MASATVPVTSTLSPARARTAGAGSLPTSRSRAWGTRVSTSGQISRPSQSAASTLGPIPSWPRRPRSRPERRAAPPMAPCRSGTPGRQRASGGQPRPFPLADHDHVIELPDRAPFHPPEGSGLRTEQRGPDSSPGVRVASHEGRLHIVEIQDRHLRREVEHERHHLLVLDLQQVDGHRVSCAADGLDHRRAPEPSRRDAARLDDPSGHPPRSQPPRDGPHVDPQVAETRSVRAAVVIPAQHEIAQPGEAAGDRQRTLVPPVVVRQRKKLGHHERPHRSAPAGADARCLPARAPPRVATPFIVLQSTTWSADHRARGIAPSRPARLPAGT